MYAGNTYNNYVEFCPNQRHFVLTDIVRWLSKQCYMKKSYGIFFAWPIVRGNMAEPAREHNAMEARDKPLDDILKELSADPRDGLSQAEARKRIEEYGYNAVDEERKSPVLQFLSHFWGPIPWMIEIALILSGLIHRWEAHSFLPDRKTRFERAEEGKVLIEETGEQKIFSHALLRLFPYPSPQLPVPEQLNRS